ncbi:O-antigen ligase family protein [Sphingorhabdus sp.]|uniref:O-antigen ligase family protein n=1 Tax=Sphingorhabdus sp. TaxID=1902408 RepID=UPI003BB17BB9
MIASSSGNTVKSNGFSDKVPNEMSGVQPWFACMMLLAIAPLLHLLATWDMDGVLTAKNHFLRLYSIPVVFAEVCAVLFAMGKNWSPGRQFRTLHPALKWLLAIFVAWGLIGSILSAYDPAFSVLFFMRYLLQILLLGVLVHVIGSRSFSADRWFTTFTLISMVYVTGLVIFCFVVPDPENFKWVERMPSATNIRQIGNVVGIMALIPTAALVFAHTARPTLLAFLSLTLLLAFMFWTGTRGAFVGYVLAVIGTFIWLFRTASFKNIGLILLSGVAAFLISAVAPKPAPEFGMGRMVDSVSSGDATSGRIEMWIDAIEAIKAAPLIGHGSGTYRENMMAANNYPYNHPHNSILQFAYDWGIVGAIFALALLAWLGIMLLLKSRSCGRNGWAALSAFVCLLAISAVEGTLFHPLPIVLALALMAPALAFTQNTVSGVDKQD